MSMLETEDPRELTAMLQPYMDVLKWDVRAIYPLDRDSVMQTIRQNQGQR